MRKILVVDDDRGARESLKAIFSSKFTVKLAEDADQALQRLEKDTFDLALLDVNMPGKSGVELLAEIKVLYPELPIIMVSASTGVQSVVEAIKQGANDYITKPYDVDEIRLMVDRIMESNLLQRQVEVLQTEVNREYPVEGIIGQSAPFQKALEDARKAAESDATVLITGAGRGLGLEMARQLAQRGDTVFATVRSPAKADALRALEGDVRLVALDVSDEASIAKAAEAVGERSSRLGARLSSTPAVTRLRTRSWSG